MDVQQALDVLDAARVRRFADGAVRLLELHRADIDRQNVFPVADRDTGTNLLATLRGAAAALDTAGAEVGDDGPAALRVLATGAVHAAAGNSGTILAQILRALADTATASGSVDAATLREGLGRAAVQARAAVADPVAGTMLTVADAVAEAVANPVEPQPASLSATATAAVRAAAAAVRRTPTQLAVLAAAGVVDAGAHGLLLVLTALSWAVDGLDDGVPDAGPALLPDESTPPPALAAPSTVAPGRMTAGYEVQYLLAVRADLAAEPGAALAGLRAELAAVADSVVVVDAGDGTWTVHAHTTDVGAVLERGLARGRASAITVEPLVVDGGPEPATSAAAVDRPCPPRRVVAVSTLGAGLAGLFAGIGVRVVDGAAAGWPDVVAAAGSDCREVVVLVDAAALHPVVEVAAERLRAGGARVAVVPTRSPVQTLAAVAVHAGDRAFDDDVVAMAEAAAATRVAELLVAEGEALTTAGRCQAGDVLGLIDGEVVDIGRGMLAVALAVADRLLGVGAELVTVLVAGEVGAGVAETLRRHVRERSPLTEVAVYPVAPAPDWSGSPLIIGVE